MIAVSDLEAFLQQDLSDYPTEAQAAVDQGIGVVEAHCKRRFAQVTGDVRTMRWRARIVLPDPPVSHISSITVDGIDCPYEIDATGNAWLGRHGSQAVITYTHGFATVPEAVRLVALRLASRIFKNPMGRVSYTSEGQTYSAAMDVSPRIMTGDEMAILRRFRLNVGQ